VELRNNGVVKSEILGGRERVARSLLVDGPATAAELSQRLGITSAGVRKHLDTLEADGDVVAGDRPPFGPVRGPRRGRPARIYSLTDAGRQRFEQAYDDLAVSAMRFLAQVQPDALDGFARRRAEELEQRYRPHLEGISDPGRRAERLAELLSADGYAASVEEGQTPVLQVCQHNCPVSQAAHEFPQLCDAEAAAFARLLNTNVTRLATIAHGDGVCTCLVSPSAAHAPTERISS
jgi:predicted ArsR family transcriptional regulator